MFDAIDISATGLGMSNLWLEVLSHNLANLNTVRASDDEPFRALMLRVREDRSGSSLVGSGVSVVSLDEVEGEGELVYDPTNPLAGEDDNVRRPVVDLATQMTNLIVATRAYQLNLQSLQSSREAYQSALRIGQA